MKEQKEEQNTNYNYKINLYVLIQQLIDGYSEYENMLLEIEETIKNNNKEMMEEDQAKKVQEYVKLLRKIISQIQIHIETLETDEKELKPIKESYEKTKKQYIINKNDLREHTLKLNKYVIKKIMPETTESNDLRKIY